MKAVRGLPLLIALFTLLFAAAPPMHALEVDTWPTPELQQRYDALIHELRCMQCQNQSIADSPVGLASDLRRDVREQLLAGKSDDQIRAAIGQIPSQRRKVISTHDAFGYFAAAYGIAFIAPQGVSTESEASARDIARIITQIRSGKIPAVFLENISDPRLIRRISAETGAKVGGTLYSDSLTGEKGDAPTYIDMVRHNIKALTDALDH